MENLSIMQITMTNNKDVVSLIPVHKMTTQVLTHMTMEVVKNITEAGYIIPVLIHIYNNGTI